MFAHYSGSNMQVNWQATINGSTIETGFGITNHFNDGENGGTSGTFLLNADADDVLAIEVSVASPSGMSQAKCDGVSFVFQYVGEQS